MSTPDLDAHTPCQCEACRIIDAQDAKDDDLNAWADYNRKPQQQLDQLRASLSALATEMRQDAIDECGGPLTKAADHYADVLTALLDAK